VKIGAKALWLQLGIASDEARAIAEEAGLDYVEDSCMASESRRLGISKEPAA
jgi:predicted CoA-binding protein